MIAIDTNLIVRYIAGDHPEQSLRAREIIDTESVFVAATVVMEVASVLRTTFGFSRTDIVNSLRIFAGMPSVTIEDADLVAAAFDLVEKGMDFADALHLLRVQHCDALVTFDRKFIKAAHAAGHPFVREP
ncbi:twitching motility protein PilT [Rhizobium sp. Root708]|uniref:type II toxin-antitoxin system VapC family toxin n=1 Tax=Rhizobium sp. Root708 TaxID=1736592 RepID=UPI0006F89D63|nr:type II toxin-antitoxin system VapC family toxin [Rhizobium sp. Root708]KRB58665.1 twitching motility protein PilT [Rhizobium sp. Root708]